MSYTQTELIKLRKCRDNHGQKVRPKTEVSLFTHLCTPVRQHLAQIISVICVQKHRYVAQIIQFELVCHVFYKSLFC